MRVLPIDLVEVGSSWKESVEAAEAFADGSIQKDIIQEFEAQLFAVGARDSSITETWMPVCEVSECGWYAAELAVGCTNDERTESSLVRDIFGNPFRPVMIDPRWLTSNVLDLATSIYVERAFERMPILADALMDAGCANDDIIQHCRGDVPHVRGCWVVDLILRRE